MTLRGSIRRDRKCFVAKHQRFLDAAAEAVITIVESVRVDFGHRLCVGKNELVAYDRHRKQ